MPCEHPNQSNIETNGANHALLLAQQEPGRINAMINVALIGGGKLNSHSSSDSSYSNQSYSLGIWAREEHLVSTVACVFV